MSILVATDFSPARVLQSARRLRWPVANGRPLVLVHAVEPPSVDVPIGVTGWGQDLLTAAEIGVAHEVTRDGGAGLARWQGGASLRLAVATDGSGASQAALSWAGTFAQSQPCALSIVRLYWPPEEAVRYGLDDPWDGAGRDHQLLPLLERDLRRDTQTLVGQTPERLRLRAAGQEASDVLAEEAATIGADALVIGVPQHRSQRWTVLAPGPVLRSSKLPVLCVPEPRTASRAQPRPVWSVLVATDLSEASDQVVGPAYGVLLPAGGRADLIPAASAFVGTSARRDQARAAWVGRRRGSAPIAPTGADRPLTAAGLTSYGVSSL
jgi:nucleotide-binding universal stress UspA family protein